MRYYLENLGEQLCEKEEDPPSQAPQVFTASRWPQPGLTFTKGTFVR